MIRSRVGLCSFVLVATGCELTGDGARDAVISRVQEAAGDPQAKVWDVKICRDAKSGDPLNATGFVTGGKNGRVFLVQWKDGALSGDVDIEYEDPSDLLLPAYYQALRSERDRERGCRVVGMRVAERVMDHKALLDGASVGDVMRLSSDRARAYASDTSATLTDR